MSTPSPAPLDRALDLSQRMLAASDQADWDTLQALQAQLDQALRDAGPASEHTRHAFETLAARHQRISAQAQAACLALGQELGRQRYNQRALHAYLARPR